MLGGYVPPLNPKKGKRTTFACMQSNTIQKQKVASPAGNSEASNYCSPMFDPSVLLRHP